MHPLRAKYLASETALSMAINAAISIGFAWLVFHGHDHVRTSGPGGLVRDAAPQTFMITLMSTLVPSLVTRKRMHSGHLDTWLRGQPGGSPAPAGKSSCALSCLPSSLWPSVWASTPLSFRCCSQAALATAGYLS